jgi:hypothetical protein
LVFFLALEIFHRLIFSFREIFCECACAMMRIELIFFPINWKRFFVPCNGIEKRGNILSSFGIFIEIPKNQKQNQ